MFREMRRKKQQLSQKEAETVLRRGTSGVLAVSGDDGYPYAVPLSYVYEDGKLYFHCAREGHKLDAIRACDKASFCVIDKDEIVPDKFTTYFRSVIAFGKVRVIEDSSEKRASLASLARRYCAEVPQEMHEKEINSSFERLHMLEMTIEHMTGKQAIELA